MKESKYYDVAAGRPLTLEHGCEFGEWAARAGEAAFALHPKGVMVFVPPSDIVVSDEYAAGDLYAVEENADSEFQRRRFGATISLLEAALAGGPPRPRLLDVGCGEGHITAEIQARFPAAEISALDYSLSAVERAKDKYPRIDFAVADACAPPYAPDYFDAAVCNNLFEHLPNPLQLLAGLRRVLKPGGSLIISTPSRYRFDNLVRVLMGKPVRLMSAQHVTEYSVGQITEMLRFGGFAIERTADPPIRREAAGLRETLAYRLLLPLVRAALGATRSHHSLESTVFFLARKT